MNSNPAYQGERREEVIDGKTVIMAPASSCHVYLEEITDEEKAIVVTEFKCHLIR